MVREGKRFAISVARSARRMPCGDTKSLMSMSVRTTVVFAGRVFSGRIIVKYTSGVTPTGGSTSVASVGRVTVGQISREHMRKYVRVKVRSNYDYEWQVLKETVNGKMCTLWGVIPGPANNYQSLPPP